MRSILNANTEKANRIYIFSFPSLLSPPDEGTYDTMIDSVPDGIEEPDRSEEMVLLPELI